jgi:predicted RNA-binding Zn ribbon-like protein
MPSSAHDSHAEETSTHGSAPGELAILEAFVNTLHDGLSREDLTDLNALRRWFVRHGLLAARDRLADGDLARALAVREALRDLLSAHNGDVPSRRARSVLNRAAQAAPVVLRFDEHGHSGLVPAGRGLDGALARLFAIMQAAVADGTWERLKSCSDAGCRYAFYDRSRNRSGTWCDMASCGNRAKARAFRGRQAG